MTAGPTMDQEQGQQQPVLEVEPQFPDDCSTLLDRCVYIMNILDPIQKANLTLLLGRQWKASNNEPQVEKKLKLGRATPPEKPPRPDTLEFVRPGFGVKIGKAGSTQSRIAILHSLANVEQWALDGAVDNCARFGYYSSVTSGTKDLTSAGQTHAEVEYEMPQRYFDDFIQMACDEAKHFKWLHQRLIDLGANYGDLPVHGSIWDSCHDTAQTALARMAVVHMVLEARGLDVNPSTIARFDRGGDSDSARMLEKIHADEVTHVQIGHRWFCYLLMRHEKIGSDIQMGGEGDLYEFKPVGPVGPLPPPIQSTAEQESGLKPPLEYTDPVEALRMKRFQEVVVQYFKGALKPPFNTVDRDKGGLTRGWYEPLIVVRERTGLRPSALRRKEAAAATLMTDGQTTHVQTIKVASNSDASVDN